MVTVKGRTGVQSMAMPLSGFIKSYLKALEEGDAAVFAGAGLSMPSGFVNWRTLLRDVAEDLSLDINKETDLLSVAQYHVNEFGRGRINQVLLDEFYRTAAETENHRILAALPVRSFWTTNYDNLIESALRAVGKSVDVKVSTENLALTARGHDAVVYKMHGDASAPDRAVLTKNDFETYNHSRRMFTTALQSDLASKTFLFLGFSFNDPNLDSILGRMKTMLGESVRPHYCLMRQELRRDFDTDADYAYARTRQQLKMRDLVRYGIQVVLVESYEQITEILRKLQILLRRNCVFLSGTAEQYGNWHEDRAWELGETLGQELVGHGFRIATGYGLRVGDSVIRGVLQKASKIKTPPAARLHLGCLPDPLAGDSEWRQYRSDMLGTSGSAIFLFGNKTDASGLLVDANGMFEEFKIGLDQKVVPVPVGATGFAAEKLWQQVMDNFREYVGDEDLRSYYEDLGNKSLSNADLVDRILRITSKLASP